jgi:uroporphyrinogen decarboxylase
LIDNGLDAINPVQVSAAEMDPAEMKAEFGDRMAFWGGIDTQELLPHGTPEQVAAETRRTIDILGAGGGYVLNSVHNIQADVPPENVIAMFETARDYRR